MSNLSRLYKYFGGVSQLTDAMSIICTVYLERISYRTIGINSAKIPGGFNFSALCSEPTSAFSFENTVVSSIVDTVTLLVDFINFANYVCPMTPDVISRKI